MVDIEELRYPVGRFSPTAESTVKLRAEQIESLRRLPENLRNAVAGLSDRQLDTPYREDGWTVRQVVHHLADSHANSFIRFKLALTEDWPTVKPYDEAAWARLPDATSLPIHSSLALIDGLQERWTALLLMLSDEDFQKGFDHPEIGRQTLARSLALYAWHARHHTAHITRLRERMGW